MYEEPSKSSILDCVEEALNIFSQTKSSGLAILYTGLWNARADLLAKDAGYRDAYLELALKKLGPTP